jgi:hypothetical protein
MVSCQPVTLSLAELTGKDDMMDDEPMVALYSGSTDTSVDGCHLSEDDMDSRASSKTTPNTAVKRVTWGPIEIATYTEDEIDDEELDEVADEVRPRFNSSSDDDTPTSSTTLLEPRSELSFGLLSATVPPPPGLITPTSLMLRNLPNDYSRDDLILMLDSEGFAALYDFVYLPIDFTSGMGLGYCFVNFVTNLHAAAARKIFSGFRSWNTKSAKVCEAQWSQTRQTLEEHINHFRNNSLMHPGIPDALKPVLFKDGKRVEFPEPTTRFLESDKLIKRCKKMGRKTGKNLCVA